MEALVNTHPWADDLWVVTVGGEMVSCPMTKERAERAASYLRRKGVPVNPGAALEVQP